MDAGDDGWVKMFQRFMAIHMGPIPIELLTNMVAKVECWELQDIS